MPILDQVLLIDNACSLHAPCLSLLYHVMLVRHVVTNHPHLIITLFNGNLKVSRVIIPMGCIIAFTKNNCVCVGRHTNLWMRIVMEDKSGSSPYKNCVSIGDVGNWGFRVGHNKFKSSTSSHGHGYEILPHVVVPLLGRASVVHGYDTHGRMAIKVGILKFGFFCSHGA